MDSKYVSSDKKRILVIAGSDSSGGAGLEADQKVIAAHRCYAMTATTALTAQNTLGVYNIHHTPPSFVKQQIDACIDDIGVDVVKIGMLASAETVDIVASCLQKHSFPPCIIDPVMISSTGHRLLALDAISSFRQKLLSHATVLTPNVPEAMLLLEDAGDPVCKLEDISGITRCAQAVQRLGPKFVLLKGGHMPMTSELRLATEESERQLAVNVVVGDGLTYQLIEPWSTSQNTHGTGCSLASAVACNLALGYPMREAIDKACQYVNAGIRLSVPRGKGSGPINHFHSSYMLPFSPSHFVEYLIAGAGKTWHRYTHHSFVQGMADGSLPIENFKYFLIQDYLFLTQYGRAMALGASKQKKIQDIAKTARQIEILEKEMNLHLDYCRSFGISRQDMESTKPSLACVAYTRYVLDIGNSGDWYSLQIALAPCLLGYGEIGRRLYDDPKTLKGENNQYWKWITNYVDTDYVQAVDAGKVDFENHALLQSPSRVQQLLETFVQATELETAFWDMGVGGGKDGS